MQTISRTAIGLLLAFALLMTGPIAMLSFGNLSERGSWSSSGRGSAGLAPNPQTEPAAVVQVYAARTIGWRGAFGVHTWIATKRARASQYTVHHVLGWRYYHGGSPVVSRVGTPDFKWFGALPNLLVDHRGADVGALIDDIEQAVADYPHDKLYRVWPGPNSNTFTAFIAREVPALELDLPPNALGKDYLGMTRWIAPASSGTGWQVSILGLLGITVARLEGIEVNIMGLSAGFDFDDLALRLPGIGRVSLWPEW